MRSWADTDRHIERHTRETDRWEWELGFTKLGPESSDSETIIYTYIHIYIYIERELERERETLKLGFSNIVQALQDKGKGPKGKENPKTLSFRGFSLHFS